MGFKNLKEIVDTIEDGGLRYSAFRRITSALFNNPCWADTSMFQGIPSPNYYASSPLQAKALSRANGGIYHGASISPQKKYLKKITTLCNSSSTLSFILADYLMYYPFCDDSVDTPQVMDNTQTLPRYTSGEGVKIIAVSVASRIGNKSFTVTYTNSEGVSGRVTPPVFQSAQALSNGAIISMPVTASTNGLTPFIQLQAGDTGVRSIESVQMTNVDVGLFTLALVKPLATHAHFESTSPSEKDFSLSNGFVLPEIDDEAYLGLLMGNGTVFNAAAFSGILEIINK